MAADDYDEAEEWEPGPTDTQQLPTVGPDARPRARGVARRTAAALPSLGRDDGKPEVPHSARVTLDRRRRALEERRAEAAPPALPPPPGAPPVPAAPPPPPPPPRFGPPTLEADSWATAPTRAAKVVEYEGRRRAKRTSRVVWLVAVMVIIIGAAVFALPPLLTSSAEPDGLDPALAASPGEVSGVSGAPVASPTGPAEANTVRAEPPPPVFTPVTIQAEDAAKPPLAAVDWTTCGFRGVQLSGNSTLPFKVTVPDHSSATYRVTVSFGVGSGTDELRVKINGSEQRHRVSGCGSREFTLQRVRSQDGAITIEVSRRGGRGSTVVDQIYVERV